MEHRPIPIETYLSSQANNAQLLLNDLYLPGSTLQSIFSHLSKQQQNNKLEFLSLRGTAFTSDDFAYLFNFLVDNQFMRLKCLGLEWNRIGCSGLQGLIGVVELGVEVIDLKNNQIGSEEVEVLKALLEKESKLRVIDLRWNQIDSKDGERLLEGLEKNKSVVVLELSGNKISNKVMENIDRILKQNIRDEQQKSEEKSKPMNVVEAIEGIQTQQKEHLAHSDQQLNENQAKLNKLEQAMLIEKKMGLENRGRLEAELSIIRQQDQQRLFRLRNLTQDLTNQSQKNNFLKNEIKRYQSEMDVVHSTKGKQLEQSEERLMEYQQEMSVLEMSHKGKIDNMLRDQDMILEKIDQKYCEQLSTLTGELDMLEQGNIDLDGQIHELEQEVISNRMQREEQLRGYSDSFNNFQLGKIQKEQMENYIEITIIEKEIQRVGNWNSQRVQERDEKNRMRVEELGAQREELAHLEQQLSQFAQKKNEYQIIIERIKNEKRIQKNRKKQLSEDIKVLEEIREKKKGDQERKVKMMKEEQDNGSIFNNIIIIIGDRVTGLENKN